MFLVMTTVQSIPEGNVEELKRLTRLKLARVCEGWSEADCEALVEHIVQVELKYRPTTVIQPVT